MPDPSNSPVTSIDILGQGERAAGTEDLDDLARQCAASQTEIQRESALPPLTHDLPEYREILIEAVQHFRGASDMELALSFAAEWLLDNDFLALEALRQIAEDLPPQFNRQLPILAAGPLAGYARIFALARELIVLSKARIDLESVRRFLEVYQSTTPLSMGELWALPIMLRLGILHVLTCAAARLTDHVERLDRLPLARLEWIGESSDDEIIASSFTSLRRLANQDWKDYFESLSLVHRTLADDPAEIYPWMDFTTRDRYRKAVEELALATLQDESQVAREAIRLAQAQARGLPAPGGTDSPELSRGAHVGFYLIDRGRETLEKRIGYRPSVSRRLLRWTNAHAVPVYLSSLAAGAGAILALITAYALRSGGSPWQAALAVVLGLVPALTVAVQLVNWLITHLTHPRVLPKMDFTDGLPPGCSTLVVIPALLNTSRDIQSLLSQLEQHSLSNADPNLYYALLSDFADAAEPLRPEDEALIEEARTGIQALNRKYSRGQGGPFLLLHRERRWNPREGRWMGWERKRGKLHELNQLILEARAAHRRGEALTRPLAGGSLPFGQNGSSGHAGFAVQICDLDVLPEIRYVITLDADTLLPPESANRLVATLAHPLNRAEFDDQGRISAGYSILQPRTEISPTSAIQSTFTRIYSGEAGLDLYTLAVSDVYQDLFGEGIYVGKGIYDVEAFERSLDGRVPENALLSHDLFEGLFARAALVSDIFLIEDYPSRYLTKSSRQHRWIRGDWQLLPWLLPVVPAQKGTSPNPLKLLDRWKIFDNMRRSLAQAGALLLLAAAWVGLLPGSLVHWTLGALLALSIPLMMDLTNGMLRMGNGRPGHRANRPGARAASSVRLQDERLLRWLLAIAFLPFEALLALEAISITLARLIFIRRNLLKWTTAAETERRFENGVERLQTWRQMAGAPISSGLFAIILIALRAEALPIALPLLGLWFLSPELAYRVCRPSRQSAQPLPKEGRNKLRSLARRTWLFFEQFVGPEDHWLPPDHFQEAPLGVLAHRTSPTNIGLNLLSILGAYDLGYIGLLGTATRLRSSLDTLMHLERYRGHFLNWYDTRTLNPLATKYVSTVDSGNLAACLIALRQGLMDIAGTPVLRWETMTGWMDGLALLSDHIQSLEAVETGGAATRAAEALLQLRQRILAAEGQPEEWASLLLHLSGPGWEELGQRLRELVEEISACVDADSLRRLRLYVHQTRQGLDNAQREVEVLHPWLKTALKPPQYFTRTDLPPKLATAWQSLRQALPTTVPLGEIPQAVNAAREALKPVQAELRALSSADPASIPIDQVQSATDWCLALDKDLESAALSAKALLIGLGGMADEAEAYVREMDFSFLFDPDRQVFHLGYNLAISRLDGNYYDLLASESRIASLVAIAKGEVPVSHWLHLSRPLAHIDGHQALLSWSATMFEYLMSRLLLRDYEGTLLAESAAAAVEIQIGYGAAHDVPWGISESGYYKFDQGLAYQYRAFGVPGLGYKRGLGDDLVVAPYASLLALPLRPQAVLENIADLEALGAQGTFGFYEALDFTPARLALGSRFEMVREYMAHHQGMVLVSLVNYLLDDRMVKRFHRDPRIRSVELLLQEQIPQDAPLQQPHAQESRAVRPLKPGIAMTPWRARVNAPRPRIHYLSNGRFGTLITASGGGYSAWRDLDLTRWRADTTLGGWGTWVYIQDLDRDWLWSAGYEPTHQQPDQRDVTFNAHLASFHRQDGEITTRMDIAIAPEDDVEIRTLTLMNQGDRARSLRLTSYAEVVLGSQATDRRHPAFSKLFLESEYVPEDNLLLFRRRPRSEKDEVVYLAHGLVIEPGLPLTRAFESDRARFLGRGGTAMRPQALSNGSWLSGTAGATLDPILSLGQEIHLEPHASRKLAFLTLVAPTRQAALALARRYSAWNVIEHAFEGARAAAESELRQLGLRTTQLPRIQNLLSSLLYPHAALRAPASSLRANRKGQPGLWPYAISGDYPILLASIAGPDELPLVQDLLQAHTYWRNRRLMIDLVFLNEQGLNYGQELTTQLHRLLSHSGSEAWLNRRGGIFLILADQLRPEDRTLLETAARVYLDGSKGGLTEQFPGGERLPLRLPAFMSSLPDQADSEPTHPLERPQGMLFDNGLGGFSPDGREYLIYLEPGRRTPAPWINVIANPGFGCLASESGLGYTWAGNSGENRLTPWSNDPVSDPPDEAVYIRDEETAVVWSPTPLPCPAQAPYLVRHGAGYTVFEHNSQGLEQRLRLFAAPEAPVKVIQLRVKNTWSRVRRLTVTYYARWTLGVSPEETQPYIIPEFDGDTQALLASNPYNVEFGEQVAFAAASKKLHGLTADRTEFLGRIGDRSLPAALKRIGLAGTVRPGLDACAALQLHIDLQPGETEEVTFLLGQGADREDALRLARQYQDAAQVAAAWEDLQQRWERLLGAVSVDTPDPGMNLLMNRWLLYQTLACRIWGRSGFYQSSGAYGFRDQLQDVMALVYAAPGLAREHLLRAARHQFEAGDVLHWWHPPSGRGVRTRFSDDLLWLPYVTAFYVSATRDAAVLDEPIPFLTGLALEHGQDERYGLYSPTPGGYSLYEHCLRALERGSTAGEHGLPLIGCGDWNDGMNRVGAEGRGESVWLAWFLIATLREFANICEGRGEPAPGQGLGRAERLRQRAAELAQAVEEQAWDGAWYLRAFYDDGSPLGSSRNRECQIDAIAQSWAVLSGAGEPARAREAMQSVARRLVRPQERLILLFTPPFDRTPHDPGYIKGYLPGIRENGGQYTHASIWTAWAFARLGDGDAAGRLFDLLNPIDHADTPEKIDRYKVEPYAIAADVYGVAPHTGRGGWTWYTGSAGWLYRLGLEAILGLRLEGESLSIDPCIQKSWPGFEVSLRHGETSYRIKVENPLGVNGGVKEVRLDDQKLDNRKVPLVDDGQPHEVRVTLGPG